MNADDTVRQSLYFFPTLYENRTQALEHLLCVTGSGTYWENGEVVRDFDYEAWEQGHPHHEDAEQALQAIWDRWNEEQQRLIEIGVIDEPEIPGEYQIASWKKTAAEEARRVSYVRGNLDELVQLRAPFNRVYPMHDGSKLAQIPDDITDSWLDTCEETARMVLDCDQSYYRVNAVPAVDVHGIEEAAAGALGRAPRSLEQITVAQEERSRQGAEADAKAVAVNHRIARQALDRIAEIRAARAARAA